MKEKCDVLATFYMLASQSSNDTVAEWLGTQNLSFPAALMFMHGDIEFVNEPNTVTEAIDDTYDTLMAMFDIDVSNGTELVEALATKESNV